MSEANSTTDWPTPWPIEVLKKQLEEGSVLYQLTQPRRVTQGHDIREHALEHIAREVMIRQFGNNHVIVRKQIGNILKLRERPFPAKTMPDISVEHQYMVHIAELKSSRTDYNRFDNVFDSRPFRKYLESCNHTGGAPWEVEQDLIKLHLFQDLSPRVGSCLFLMVDAYEGSGRSWTNVFANRRAFLETMRTDMVKDFADKLLDVTRIEPLEAKGASARLITCVVHSWKP